MRARSGHSILFAMKLRRGGIRLIALAGVIAAGALAPPASAAPPTVPLPECATPVTLGELSIGQPAIGFTVRQGETVEEFDVTILGVEENGLGPGRDLIVVTTDGPVIDEGGISAGMSGSPVYTTDGELIGAIGYSFSFGSSPVGGVTPAPDMLRVLSEPEAAAAAEADAVVLEGALRRRARAAGTSRAALSQGLRRLPLPLAVSGLMPHRAAALGRAAERRGLPFVLTGGGGSSLSAPIALGSIEPSATLEPGDSFAAALSYGDVDISAIGTTTYVCDDRALAFGHPFLFSGRTVVGASRAFVFSIVNDTFVPFKLAQPTDPVGVVDRDRLAGIRARVGEQIPTVPVTQTTRAPDTGAVRAGARTEIVRSPGDAGFLLPDVAVTHAFSNIDVTYDQLGAGSSLVTWTVRGKRQPSGRPWQLQRTNRFSSSWDIAFMSVLELWDDLITLMFQRAATVDIDSIDIDVTVNEAIRQYRVAAVKWATRGKRFKETRSLRARPREPIRARVLLRDTRNGGARRVKMKFRAPKRPGSGTITVSGGGGFFDDDFFFFDDELDFFLCAAARRCEGRTPKANGFDELLGRLRKRPRNDDLVGQMRFNKNRKTVVRRTDRVVSGFKSVRVSVSRRRR